MLDAMAEYQGSSEDMTAAGSIITDRAPGKGTIIYLTIPVYEDGAAAENALRLSDAADLSGQAQSLSSSKVADDGTHYTLLPYPSPTSANGSFRIMVADDVLVLRKGMVHTILDLWSKRFPNCPVSISTACSAEDLLRAAAMQPFDLIICDHLFNADYSTFNQLSVEELRTHGRPNVVFGGTTTSPGALRKIASEYFDTERFTVEEGDGSLLGVEALTQLAEAPNPPFMTPVLLLLSGHKIEVPPSLGVVVAQKPLKQSEFVPLLEAHALFLLNTGRCMRGGDTTSDSDVYPKSIHSSGSDYIRDIGSRSGGGSGSRSDYGSNSGSGSRSRGGSGSRSGGGSGSRSGGGSGDSGSGSESDSLVNGHGSQIFFRCRLAPLRLEAASMARVPLVTFPAARLP
jgi:CheY-like chemotaxis protein